MRKGLTLGLLILLLWTSTALALPMDVCACTGREPPLIPGLSREGNLEVMTRAHQYAKTITDAQLSAQQLRNAVLQEGILLRQEQLLARQLAGQRLETAKTVAIMIGALTTAAVTVGPTVKREWEQYCERVEVEGHEVLICPF